MIYTKIKISTLQAYSKNNKINLLFGDTKLLLTNLFKHILNSYMKTN